MRKKHFKTHINFPSHSYEWRRAYYQLYAKPYTNKRNEWSEGRYKCVMCGFRRRLKDFKFHFPEMFMISPRVGKGNKGFTHEEANLNHPVIVSMHKSYIKACITVCRDFLSRFDPEFNDYSKSQQIKSRTGDVKTSSFFDEINFSELNASGVKTSNMNTMSIQASKSNQITSQINDIQVI